MSAGICGKRLGFEEIFGSPSPIPSAKRSCFSRYDSPARSTDFGFGTEDKVSILLRMFPSMDREVVETVLNSHTGKIDDAIKCLHDLCLGESSRKNEPVVTNLQSNDNINIDVMNVQTSELKYEVTSDSESRVTHDVSSWVDIFVQEMMNASDWNDVRSRAMIILDSFEGNVVAHPAAMKEVEISSLKEQLQCLLRDNQILKRAVAIQHERNLEYDEKLKEGQQLKNIMTQYQEKIRTLEVMPMRGRGRAYWGPSSSSTPSVTETEVEEEVVAEVVAQEEAEDVLDEQPPTGSRKVIEATTTKVFTDPQAVRRATDILKRRWITPWTTWRDVSGVERDAMFEYFMHIYTCAAEDMGSIRSTWEASMQRRLTGTLQRARRDAIAASGSHDMTAWLPHHPRWMSPDVWAQMIGKWNNEDWKQRSQTARQNRLTLKEGEVTKYAGGSIPLIAHKERMAKSLGKVPSHAEVFKKTHTRKGTEDFVDARSRKFMEDYNAAFSEKYGESSPPPVDFDGEAWMRAGGDTSRGRVYGFSAGDSPGECSSAPHRRRASQRSHADASSASDEHLERVVERVFKRLSSTSDQHLDARIVSILNRRLGKEPVAPETDEVEDENEDEGGD